MSEDQFTRLFNYLQQELSAIRKDLKANSSETHEVYNVLDDMRKTLDDSEAERLALNSNDDRQQEWIRQLALATSTELVPEP